MKHLALSLFLLAACSDDTAPDPYTWGDVSIELATSYCTALKTCGYTGDQAICAEHTRWHLCEPDHSCDVELPAEAAEASAVCAEAMLAIEPQSQGCFLLGYGATPPECAAVFAFKPDPQDAGN